MPTANLFFFLIPCILSTGDLGVVQVYPMLGESRVIGPELRAACLNLGPMSSGAL